MAVCRRVLECPFCNEILEVEPPDSLHTAYSSKKPMPKSYHADVIKTKHSCTNPNCKKTITVYWYAPLDYFEHI
jgi:hypothetical protein